MENAVDTTRSSSNCSVDTVIFDGECQFCSSSIEILRKLNFRDRLRFVSLHDASIANDFPDLTFEQMMKEMWVASDDGRRFGGADALRYLSRRLPSLYPLAPFFHLPGTMPFWRFLYKFVAKNRYRIAGKKCSEGTCRLHGR
jgi:predicted DCC family thiol-disulfide oxidoreductase YuxK